MNFLSSCTLNIGRQQIEHDFIQEKREALEYEAIITDSLTNSKQKIKKIKKLKKGKKGKK